MKIVTYQNLFEGEIVLNAALRHVAQEFAVYESGEMTFRSKDGEDAFWLIEFNIRRIRAEREQKKALRKKFRRAVA